MMRQSLQRVACSKTLVKSRSKRSMSFITAYFYDRFMARAEEACLKEWRKELLGHVCGDVLEIGAGTGANINYYPDSVARLVLAEPDKHMRKQLKVSVDSAGLKNINISCSAAEQIDAEDETFDYVVASLVCCSLVDPDKGLCEIRPQRMELPEDAGRTLSIHYGADLQVTVT